MQINQKKESSALQRKLEMRNSNREGSTHLVYLKKQKSVFCVFQLQTLKKMMEP